MNDRGIYTPWRQGRMSALGPGCVKTQLPSPSAQQLNTESNVRELLLRRMSILLLNISSGPPKISFYTALATRCYEAEGRGLMLLRLFQHRSEGAPR